MKNMLYESPADSVEVNGKYYKIVTDFREWLKFSDMFDDEDFDPKRRIALMFDWFEELPPIEDLPEGVQALIRFATNRTGGEQARERPPTKGRQKKVLSWSFDSAYVYAAFLAEYGIDLLTVEYMHWHTFLALFEALPEDTPIKKRMGYRAINLADIKDKKERQRIRKIQDRIRIPQRPMTAEEVGAVFG